MSEIFNEHAAQPVVPPAQSAEMQQTEAERKQAEQREQLAREESLRQEETQKAEQARLQEASAQEKQAQDDLHISHRPDGVKIINSDYAGSSYTWADMIKNKSSEQVQEMEKELLEFKERYPEGILFSSNGRPDISAYAILRVEIEGMNGKQGHDQKLVADQLGIPVKDLNEYIADLCSKEGLPVEQYTLHHASPSVAEFVPTKRHEDVRHYGGVYEIKHGIGLAPSLEQVIEDSQDIQRALAEKEKASRLEAAKQEQAAKEDAAKQEAAAKEASAKGEAAKQEAAFKEQVYQEALARGADDESARKSAEERAVLAQQQKEIAAADAQLTARNTHDEVEDVMRKKEDLRDAQIMQAKAEAEREKRQYQGDEPLNRFEREAKIECDVWDNISQKNLDWYAEKRKPSEDEIRKAQAERDEEAALRREAAKREAAEQQRRWEMNEDPCYTRSRGPRL